MPTFEDPFEDPAKDADELGEAARGLANATRRIPVPRTLTIAAASLDQVVQLVMAAQSENARIV